MTRRALIWVLLALFALPSVWAMVGASSSVQAAIATSPSWGWAIWAFVLVSVVQTQWKVHDVKKFEGLTGRQRERLRRTAEIIIFRLSIFEVLTVLGVCANVGARILTNPVIQLLLSSASLFWAVAGFVVSVLYIRRVGQDIRDTEDIARKNAARRKSLEVTLCRLRGES